MLRPCTGIRPAVSAVIVAVALGCVGPAGARVHGTSAVAPLRAVTVARCLRAHGARVDVPAALAAVRAVAQRSTLHVAIAGTQADLAVTASPADAALVRELLVTSDLHAVVIRRGSAVLVGAGRGAAANVAKCVPATPLPSPRAGRRPASVAAAASIFTVAGNGTGGNLGDGGAAIAAQIDQPRSIAFLSDGSYLVVEPFQNDVRRVWPDGTITRFAGSGVQGYSGDGGPATAARLNVPHSVSVLPSGAVLIADASNHRIREVATDGTMTTVAGTGIGGYSGDGGPARSAEINAPRCVAALPNGGFVFVDTGNQRVREVSPDGVITTVAGTGIQGFSGDGGPAAAAALSIPFAVAPTADGGLLVVDAGNQRIRRISSSGTITTVAGTGVAGYNGDGQPATSAQLDNPHNVWPTRDGGFLIADASNLRIRTVAPDGTISTLAGTGVAGYTGDGGPAAAANVAYPKAVVELPSGGILIADTSNDVVRYVGAPVAPTSVSAPHVAGLAAPGQTLRASAGGWQSIPTATYAYQWQRCDAAGAACSDLGGSTRTTYAVTTGDIGSTIRVVATATNTAGSSSRASAATPVVADLSTPPQNVVPPSVSGVPLDGGTLLANPGTWSGTQPIAFAYQWQRCGAGGAGCVDVSGATSSTYVVGAADLGSTLRVAVTATNAATSNGYEDTVLGDQPLSYWRFDGLATLVDGLDFRNGIYLGGPTASTGLLVADADGAVAFDGATQYADVPATSAWTSAPFSLEVIVRPSALPVHRTIWSEIGATKLSGWWLNTDASGNLRMFIGDGGAWQYDNPGYVLAPGATYDIVATYDGSTVHLYVNGTLVSTGPSAAIDGDVGASPMRFGAYSTGPGQFWPGTIDEASFYPTVLSAARIAAHASAAAAAAPVASSAATATAAPAPPVNLTAPAITGTPSAGQTLVGTTGTWAGTAPITYAERWQRCASTGGSCADIAGAVAATYGVTTADAGYALRLVVTATGPGGSAAASSAPVLVPAAPAAAATPTPAPAAGGAGGGGGGVPPDLHVSWQASTASAPPAGTEVWASVTISSVNAGATSDAAVSIVLPAGFSVTRIYADRGPGCRPTGPTTLACDAGWISPGTPTQITIWGATGAPGDQIFAATATSTVERENSATLGDNTGTIKLAAPAPPTPPAAGRAGSETPPRILSIPAVTGTPRVGRVLHVRRGRWRPTPAGIVLTWQICLPRGCTTVGTGAVLRLTKVHLGHRIRVVESAVVGGATVTAASAPVAVLAAGARRR